MTQSKNDGPSDAVVRFVVLFHEQAGNDHYDLMIESGGSLATWRLPEPPERAREAGAACYRIGDHRRAYLDYEGPVSRGRGRVSRHDAGVCRVHQCGESRWMVTFDGARLAGRATLEEADHPGAEWRFRFRPARRPSG
ncbi:MAG: DNA polymerase ligase N-terminal domain-containing protein [Phycisphaerae bacterium]